MYYHVQYDDFSIYKKFVFIDEEGIIRLTGVKDVALSKKGRKRLIDAVGELPSRINLQEILQDTNFKP